MSKGIVRAVLCAGLVFMTGAVGCQQVHQAVNSLEQQGAMKPGTAKLLRAATDLGEGIITSARDFSPEQEYYIGRTTAAQILARYPLVRDQQLTAYINMVGLTLAGYADRPELFSPAAQKGAQGWHFAVVESDQINAFAAPSGFIFVTTGALQAMESEDELAGVLAHEVTHVDRRHGLDSIKKETMRQIPAKIFKDLAPEAADRLGGIFSSAIGDIVNSSLTNGYGQAYETEADTDGARLAARAGYDPFALARFIERTGRQDDRWGGKTHPPTATRIAGVQSAVANYPYRGTDERLRRERFEMNVRNR